jgi:hypothetical protein
MIRTNAERYTPSTSLVSKAELYDMSIMRVPNRGAVSRCAHPTINLKRFNNVVETSRFVFSTRGDLPGSVLSDGTWSEPACRLLFLLRYALALLSGPCPRPFEPSSPRANQSGLCMMNNRAISGYCMHEVVNGELDIRDATMVFLPTKTQQHFTSFLPEPSLWQFIVSTGEN